MKRCYPTEYYDSRAGTEQSHHGSTSVGATEWPSMRESQNGLPIENVPHEPPLEGTSDEQTIDLLMCNLISTAAPTETIAHSMVFAVENTGGKAYG